MKRTVSVILCIVLLVCSANLCTFSVSAASERTGVVATTDTALNVRSGPSTSFKLVSTLSKGSTVTIVAEATDSDNAIWYNIKSGGSVIGWVHSKYIQIIEPIEYKPEANFEDYLKKQGFPESYKPYLRNLHVLHPSWVFIADKIKPTWSTVLKEESKLARNCVETSSPDSWKSMEAGAYTKDKDGKITWVGFDGPTWVAASSSIIAYYLDPRNFLTETGVFQFLSHSFYPEYQTVDNVKKMVKGTFLENNFPESTAPTYSDVLVAAAKESHVNPYVLAASITVEQGTKGGGACISGNVKGYEGYYNYFNIGAYAANGNNAIINGLIWAKGGTNKSTTYNRPWNSRYKSIIGGSMWYGNNYVNVGQDTLYYKKFNVVNTSSGLYSHQYMTNVQAAESEGVILSRGYKDIMDTGLVFNIPVYSGIPDKAYAKPGSSGNNNNFLTALSVDGYSLTPSFNSATLDYELVVPSNTNAVIVKATASDKNAKISGTGTVTLGANTKITISVTATSGEVRKYTITVAKTAEAVEEPVINTTYTVGTSTVSGISPQTSSDALIKGFNITNGSAAVLKNGAAYSGTVGTGMTLIVYKSDKTVYYSKNILIYGDINGDGKVTITDLAKAQKQILRLESLTGNYFTAADVNKDGKISILDLAKIQNHILGKSSIAQK